MKISKNSTLIKYEKYWKKKIFMEKSNWPFERVKVRQNRTVSLKNSWKIKSNLDLIDESNPMNSEKSTLTIPIGKSPVYTFLPYTPPTLNVFGPKPFRSNHIENSNSPEPVIFEKKNDWK